MAKRGSCSLSGGCGLQTPSGKQISEICFWFVFVILYFKFFVFCVVQGLEKAPDTIRETKAVLCVLVLAKSVFVLIILFFVLKKFVFGAVQKRLTYCEKAVGSRHHQVMTLQSLLCRKRFVDYIALQRHTIIVFAADGSCPDCEL